MKKKPSFSINYLHRRQRGDTLVEAAIAMFLASILILGAVYMSSRTMVTQRNMRMQQIAIDQMHAALLGNSIGGGDICTTAPQVVLPDGESLTVTVSGCNTQLVVSVNGTNVTDVPTPLSLTVTSDKLGGTVKVGSSWEVTL